MKTLGVALVLACCVGAQTVEPEMTADRPGFRNSTHLVGPGVVQVETGLNVRTGRALGLQPEIRIGTFPWLELRLFAEDVVLRPAEAERAAGVTDLQPGIKFPVFNRIKGTRVVGILKTTVPSGHSSRRVEGYQPGAELIWEHMVTESFSFAGTWNLTRLRQEDQFVWQRGASISTNKSLGRGFRTFGEVFVLSPIEVGAGNQWSVDAGVMRPIGRFLMLDTAVGRSVHGPRDWFVTVGFAVRTRVPGFHGG